MRILVYAVRTIKELLRDPLSYVFCLGFPLVMLVIMVFINNGIPKEANMNAFRIDNLAPGIAFFGLTFVMLFTALQISKDRTTSFMNRLYASPMTSTDFIIGYTLPVGVIGILQMLITYTASYIISIIQGVSLNPVSILLSVLVLMPANILFISIGLFFGTLLNDKAAPGICSIIISGASILGGVWMDMETIGGTWLKISNLLPFYPAVKATRAAINGEYMNIYKPLLIIIVYTIIFFILAVIEFNSKMKKDLK